VFHYVAAEAEAWLRSAAFDWPRNMQRSRNQNENGPLGIRAGVWIAVLGSSLVCALMIAVFPRPANRLKSNDASVASGESAGEAPIRSTADARTTRRRSDTEFVWGGGLWVPAPQSAEDAARLACDAANQKAKELYNCKPFGHERPARVVDGRWVWSDSRGQGQGDVEATVEFALDGSVQSVDVLWLDSSPYGF